jgi:hypothetical protein
MAHRPGFAATEQSLPPQGGDPATAAKRTPQKVTEKLGTTFAGIDTKPLNLSGQRQKTDGT